MNNDAFRNLVGLGPPKPTAERDPNTTPESDALHPLTRASWPELVAYDGRMVARTIQHDRPDVRVISVSLEDLDAEYEHEDDWEAQAAPLTEDEKHTHELVVLLCVRPCREGRPGDSTVVEPPWVMRRGLRFPP